MTVRPFDWRDIPALLRYRHQSTYLDSALVLTRGSMLLPGALLSYLAPAMGLYTSVSNGQEGLEGSLIGQILHSVGNQFAHMTFLTPDESLDSPALPALLDYLAATVVERGALRLLAEVDERTTAFEAMHKAGFAIYSRQRVWQLTKQVPEEVKISGWHAATEQDVIAIRSLYSNLVPGLVQQAEPFSTKHPRGLIYRNGDELLAFVELRYGHRGIWAQPFVHPDAEDVAAHFFELIQGLPYRRSRPVYLCVRSYQAWLEPAIEDLGAEAGPRQAVMVKHLAIAQKAFRPFAIPALEGGHPEISAPLAHSESEQ
jgi:hypothetical protein